VVTVPHQILQYCELPWREIDFGSGPTTGSGSRVEDQVSCHQLRRTFGSPAADHRPQVRQQHDIRKRLGQIVIGTEIKSVGFVVFAILGGEHQDRNPHPFASKSAHHLVPRRPRQHDVQDHRVVFGALYSSQRLDTVAGDVNGESVCPQPGSQRLGQRLFVFHE
jgi:hypothetical protein